MRQHRRCSLAQILMQPSATPRSQHVKMLSKRGRFESVPHAHERQCWHLHRPGSSIAESADGVALDLLSNLLQLIDLLQPCISLHTQHTQHTQRIQHTQHALSMAKGSHHTDLMSRLLQLPDPFDLATRYEVSSCSMSNIMYAKSSQASATWTSSTYQHVLSVKTATHEKVFGRKLPGDSLRNDRSTCVAPRDDRSTPYKCSFLNDMLSIDAC